MGGREGGRESDSERAREREMRERVYVCVCVRERERERVGQHRLAHGVAFPPRPGPMHGQYRRPDPSPGMTINH